MPLVTSRAAKIESFIKTITPLFLASSEEAKATALYRFNGPSADSAVEGRIEPTSTIGLSVCTTKFRKKAVSSMVSVPWVMTTPFTDGFFTKSLT
ncbi:hypothetical protein D3C71_1599340 [compost metagenome]